MDKVFNHDMIKHIMSKGGVIHFISDENTEKVNALRSELLENSMEIIRLFSRRMEISRDIAMLKSASGMNLRIRERELEVMENLCLQDDILKSIIKSLFEFSIRSQEISMGDQHSWKRRDVSFSGNHDDLLFLLGTSISNPGVEIFSESDVDEPLKGAIQRGGGHIVVDKIPQEAKLVCLGFSDRKCFVSMPDKDHITFAEFPPLNSDTNQFGIVIA